MNARTPWSSMTWPERLTAARQEYRSGGGTVLDALLRHWEVAPDELLSALLPSTGVAAVVDAGACRAHFDVLSIDASRQLRCVVIDAGSGGRAVAAADPWDDTLPRKLRAIDRRLATEWPLVAAHATDLSSWLQGQLVGHDVPHQQGRSTVVNGTTASGPIVSFVDAAIVRAIATGASDVHFECDRTGVTVKHRLDGVMVRFARMEGEQQAQEVISRIKVLAQLDITERRLPQDGRFRFESGADGMDLRVSIMPSVHGEDAVLRLLDKAQWRQSAGSAQVRLDGLGFEAADARTIRALALEPSGMLLVTGPTGSGKTTTLYAVLSEINSGLEKIVTIEDPVEYELEGVLQIPVNERKGLTFAKGLRSILRHDPDRILVGEIRDSETAEIAVQASLTGHQVFTTVHANSVADVMGRFRHFGLDMFGFTSSLNGLVVQRLLRRLCRHCAVAQPISQADTEIFVRHGLPSPDHVRVAVGCGACHGSGYAGRFVVAEVHRVDDRLREIVTSGAALSTMKQHLQSLQVETLQRAGLRKVAEGETTLEELRRVVGSL